jgi:ribosomal protein L11 methylase PrmA
MAEEKNHLEKYLAGLNHPEAPQHRAGGDGDPQIAALHQHLMDSVALGPTDVILDIGSGTGVLATAILAVWAEKAPPRYVAVDLEGPLKELALPAAIHNNSEKIEYKYFFEKETKDYLMRPALVVIRNVFHELDINQTELVPLVWTGWQRS